MEDQLNPRRSVPPTARFATRTGSDGWQHRLLEYRREDSRGTILLAGGRGDFIEKYLEVYAFLHERGWNVVAFDWRGQGGAQGRIRGGHLSDYAPLTRDLAELIAEVRKTQSGSIGAICHSMGGHLLLRTVIEHQVPLDGAVLVAPMIAVNSHPLPAWLARRVAAIGAKLGSTRPIHSRSFKAEPAGSPRQSILTSCPDRYSDELFWWEQQPSFSLGAPSWGWLDAAYRSSTKFFTPARLKAVSVPMLILGTDTDRLVSPKDIRQAADLIPGAELLMFPNAGHELLREVDDIRLQALHRIDAFLGRHLS